MGTISTRPVKELHKRCGIKEDGEAECGEEAEVWSARHSPYLLYSSHYFYNFVFLLFKELNYIILEQLLLNFF